LIFFTKINVFLLTPKHSNKGAKSRTQTKFYSIANNFMPLYRTDTIYNLHTMYAGYVSKETPQKAAEYRASLRCKSIEGEPQIFATQLEVLRASKDIAQDHILVVDISTKTTDNNWYLFLTINA
jgi:hypothetical protein